jgi:sulfoquinovosyltransferase
MPSESETLGFVVLESLASGVPAVAVRAGGVPGIVLHNTTGLLSPPTEGADASGLCENILQLVNDPTRRTQMGIAARKYTEHMSWRIATEKLRTIQYPTAIRISETYNPGRFFSSRNATAELRAMQLMKQEEEVFNIEL